MFKLQRIGLRAVKVLLLSIIVGRLQYAEQLVVVIAIAACGLVENFSTSEMNEV